MSKNKHKKEDEKLGAKNTSLEQNQEDCSKDNNNTSCENNECNNEECCNGECHPEECHKEECGCDENLEKIATLTKQVNDLKEALLRNQADLQNYKRRKDEESESFKKYKNEDLIKELLPIIDNFERAIKMDDNDLSDEVSKFLSGFKLIYTNTLSILAKYDVKELNAEGVEFDPTYHHAVLTEHDESKPEGVVLEVLQKGYTYKDRVIRPAMVKVNE